MIQEAQLQKMFDLVKVEKDKLHEALQQVGPQIAYNRKEWRPDRPTIGCCAAVSSMIYCYHLLPEGVVPIYMKLDGGSHWLLGLPIEDTMVPEARNDGYIVANINVGKGQQKPHIIVDLTADQTDEDFDYDTGKRAVFQVAPSQPPSPSKKSRVLAKAFGYNPDEFNRAGNKKTW
jgi:hypothetical protein